jgi:hypothetical protein
MARKCESWCHLCIIRAHQNSDLPVMLSTYVGTAECDHCKRWADLALVSITPVMEASNDL